jgi:hypothetical protein
VFNTTFKNINLKRGGQFYWWRKPEYTEESTDLSQVTDKVNLIIMHKVHLVWVEFKLTTLAVMGTYCIRSCKSNYQTITITTAPFFFYKVQDYIWFYPFMGNFWTFPQCNMIPVRLLLVDRYISKSDLWPLTWLHLNKLYSPFFQKNVKCPNPVKNKYEETRTRICM